jgi:hypothetical protein
MSCCSRRLVFVGLHNKGNLGSRKTFRLANTFVWKMMCFVKFGSNGLLFVLFALQQETTVSDRTEELEQIRKEDVA